MQVSKLNVAHLVGRMQLIEQLVAIDINVFLSKEQQVELKDVWTKQQTLLRKV